MLSCRKQGIPIDRAVADQQRACPAGTRAGGLCRQGVNEIHHFVIGFGLVAMYQALLYLVAVWVVLNRPVNRWTFAIILACAAGCRLVCLFSRPSSLPISFRYVWDGRVQAAGINPYRYIPPILIWRFLRDLDIYPHINRRTTPTPFIPRERRCFSC
jgi:hypothetical protein